MACIEAVMKINLFGFETGSYASLIPSLYMNKITLNYYDRGMLMEKKNKLLCRIENNHCMMQFIYVYYYLMILKKQFFYV